MSPIKEKLKTNRGFTLQDLIVAIIALTILAGTIGSLYVNIYKFQADTKLDSLVTIYAIQMLEYIDKISYDEVTEENQIKLVNEMKNKFNIPSSFNVSLEVTKYTPSWDTEDYVRNLTLSIKYTFNDDEHDLVFKRIKVKEL